jgi:epoxyqueuosine reductase QueG
MAAKNHWMPEDLLPTAKTVIVFFIPFKESLVRENHPRKFPCSNWGIAYEVTNELIDVLFLIPDNLNSQKMGNIRQLETLEKAVLFMGT